MRPLLLISTWQKDHDNGVNDVCRGTYIYTWGGFLPYRFVFDRSRPFENLLSDEMRVEADSGLYNTSFKTQQAITWAWNMGYDWVCYAPTDCYIIVPRLLRSLQHHRDAGDEYWGFHTYDEHHIGGGSAYWLSRRAMQAVCEFNGYPDYEDRWVGTACQQAGIKAVHDELYRSIEQPYMPDAVTMHLSKNTGNYEPEVMRNLHLRVIQGAAHQSTGMFL